MDPTGIDGSLVQWGVNRLAFRTTDDGVLFLDSTAVFCDGFESGDTLAWSSTVP